tara:strand:+ start:132 stop:533 length:402 start_codon:yes stop_codon:yes gene_type:complete
MNGKQRYRCKGCGYNFTNLHGRGYPPALRLYALKLYTENVGIRSIARLLGIDPSTIVHWVRDEGKKVMEQLKASIPDSLPEMDIIEIDEMWHYTQKNSANYGYGLLCLDSPDKSLPSKWDLVVQSHSKNSGNV